MISPAFAFTSLMTPRMLPVESKEKTTSAFCTIAGIVTVLVTVIDSPGLRVAISVSGDMLALAGVAAKTLAASANTISTAKIPCRHLVITFATFSSLPFCYSWLKKLFTTFKSPLSTTTLHNPAAPSDDGLLCSPSTDLFFFSSSETVFQIFLSSQAMIMTPGTTSRVTRPRVVRAKLAT